MTRIAWFTPLRSSPPGIPCHRAALLATLRERFDIDRFVRAAPQHLQNAPPRTFSAYDFVWKHVRHPYDLTVYAVADSPEYDFVWPHLVRYPGLVVLHDGMLHRSRAAMLLAQGRDDDYRAEFQYDHPEASPGIPELGIARLMGPASDLWPMRRVVIESSRMLVAPNAWIAETLRAEASHDRIAVIEPGAPNVVPSPGTGERIRAQCGIAPDAVVFVACGPPTPRRRTDQLWSSIALLRDETPPVHLLHCGPADDTHRDKARQLGITDHVSWVGTDEASDLSACLAAAEVSVCLEWPSSHQAMTGLVESLAAATPAIVTDLADRVDIPALDPHDWQVRTLASPTDEASDTSPEPACVSIDLLDEHHSLRLAMSRLALDPVLRAKLGRGAQQLWERRFAFDRLVDDYAEIVNRALGTPLSEVRSAELPGHLRADGTARVTRLLSPFGVVPPGRSILAPPAAPEVPSDS